MTSMSLECAELNEHGKCKDSYPVGLVVVSRDGFPQGDWIIECDCKCHAVCNLYPCPHIPSHNPEDELEKAPPSGGKVSDSEVSKS